MLEHVHEWHPVLVHFTVGLLTTSVALYVAARFLESPRWRERLHIAAELNLWIGAAITGLTVGAGMIAFGAAPHHEDAKYLMTVHSWLAYGTFTLFGLLAAVSAWARMRPGPPQPSLLFLAGLLVALAALSTTGYVGGNLVFRQAVGVETERR